MTDSTNTKPTFEEIIGVQFNNTDLLTRALTHRSFVNEYDGEKEIRDNERLEFLGDAILDVIVAEMLFKKYPDVSEGELTQLRAALVKTESLAMIARDYQLGEYLRIGRGEENSGGRERVNNLCRGFEAVIGAMYLDSGMVTVEKFVMPSLLNLLEYVLENNLHIDARSELQEQIQAKLSITPSYRMAGADGPDHAKEFHMEVTIGDVVIGEGIGTSKRSAAQEAARTALLHLQEKGFPEGVEVQLLTANEDQPDGAEDVPKSGKVNEADQTESDPIIPTEPMTDNSD